MDALPFGPQIEAAFTLLRRHPAAFLRAVWPAVIASLAIPLMAALPVPPGGAATMMLLAFAVNALAFGIFCVAWTRFAVLGEQPGWPLHFRLGKREVLFGIVLQLLAGFSMVPLLMVGLLIGQVDTGPIPMPAIAFVVYHLFLILVGNMFLILPDKALRPEGDTRHRLGQIVALGGIPVGFGFTATAAPFTAAVAVLGLTMPQPEGIAGALLVQAITLVPTCLAAGTISAFLGLSWTELCRIQDAKAEL